MTYGVQPRRSRRAPNRSQHGKYCLFVCFFQYWSKFTHAEDDNIHSPHAKKGPPIAPIQTSKFTCFPNVSRQKERQHLEGGAVKKTLREQKGTDSRPVESVWTGGGGLGTIFTCKLRYTQELRILRFRVAIKTYTPASGDIPERYKLKMSDTQKRLNERTLRRGPIVTVVAWHVPLPLVPVACPKYHSGGTFKINLPNFSAAKSTFFFFFFQSTLFSFIFGQSVPVDLSLPSGRTRRPGKHSWGCRSPAWAKQNGRTVGQKRAQQQIMKYRGP